MVNKKKLNVEEINGPMVKQIDGNTHVIFTMKNFFGLISTILCLFFGFYMLVVQPRIERTEKHYDTMYNEQKELNKVFTNEIVNIKLKTNITSENILLKSQASNGEANNVETDSQVYENGRNILANITRYY